MTNQEIIVTAATGKTHGPARWWQRASGQLPAYGLIVLGVVMIITFSLALPDTFPTSLTAHSILNEETTVLLLSLGLTVVIASGEFDLSIGYMVGLLYVLADGFIAKNGLSWELSVVLVLVLGVTVGLINGLLVHVAKIDSFIATLGTGTIAYGLAIWYTGGQQIVAPLPAAFVSLNYRSILGVPQPTLIVLAVAVLLWALLEFTPAGRYLYALGFNRRAAVLSGISARKFGIAAFAISGLLVGIAGVLLAAQLQVGQSATGPEFLLPAFVGALLGKTAIKPGRPNVWGTVVAVLVLSIGIAGLEQWGGAFYVENLFNGGTLLVAVGLAGFVARRRRGMKPAAPQPVPSGEIQTVSETAPPPASALHATEWSDS